MILGNPLLNIIEITQYNIYDAYTANLAIDMVAIIMVFPLDIYSMFIEIV